MATPSAVSTSLADLTSANTVLQMMGDINSLKALSALASDSSSKADLANTNAYIASVAAGGGLANTNAAIAQLNTNLLATNTAIRLVDAQNLANTNAYIASVSSAALTSSDAVIKNVATDQSMKAKLIVDSEGASSGVDIANGHIQIFSATGNPSKIDFYCETNNAHKVTLVAPEHANYSGDVTVTLPASSGTLATTTTAATTGKAIAMAIVFG